jgi:anti-sigma B factor antagonist
LSNTSHRLEGRNGVLEEAAFSIDTTGQRVVVRGELDLATAPRLERVLSGLGGDITVDCQQLDFIDSTGLSVLARAHTRLAEQGRRLVIEGLSARCRRVFEVAGLDRGLNLAP